MKRPLFFWAGVAYATLAVVVTRPLAWHVATVVPHDLGDPLLTTAIVWWNAHVLPFTDRWWNGFAFYPATGFMAFSDPRLGESLLATPMQWMGLGPVAAANLTLLATFPLSALAAHWLAYVVTKRHDAAAICGLAYGFCPYRVAHLPHLELLAGFGMPAALAALHEYKDTRRPRWLAAFVAALVLQGFCSSYYLLFFSVLLGLWLLWFTRRGDAASLVAVLLAVGCAMAALSPLVWGYIRIHAHYGFERSFNEIVTLSADLTSLVTAHPLVLLWGWTARWGKPEGELFPGATIVLLACAGAVLAWRGSAARDRLDRLSCWLLPAACVCAAIAFCGWRYAPWRFSIGPLSASSDAPFKPMTLALAACAVWLGASSRVRAAYARRSPFAFYAFATVVLFLCSFGPKPAAAGHQFLYEAPYAWLMRLSIFESVRVPARFALPAMLALAMTGALAFARLRLQPPARRALAVAVMAGIVADGWISHLPLPRVPDSWNASRVNGFDAVLELPHVGDTFADLAATYRVTAHGRPTVNGNSGFAPMHYYALISAIEERDPSALDGLPPTDRLLMVVDKRDDRDLTWDRFLVANPRVTRLRPDTQWNFYALEPAPVEERPCSGDAANIVAATDDRGPVDLAVLTDHDPRTGWVTPHPQRVGDTLVLDLGRRTHPCAVFLAVGAFVRSYPRKLLVETSLDGATWITVASRRTAGLTIRAALDDPRNVSVPIPLAASAARFVRLRIDEAQPEMPWQVANVMVRCARGQE